MPESAVPLPLIRRGKTERIFLTTLPEAYQEWKDASGVDTRKWLFPRDIARQILKRYGGSYESDGNKAVHLVKAYLRYQEKIKQRPGVLWEHQVPGVEFLVTREYAILGDEMGLGKSFTATFAADSAAETGHILVLCPASMTLDWRDYIRTVTGETAQILRGRKADDPIEARWLLASYGVIVPQRKRVPAGTVVVIQVGSSFWLHAEGCMVALPDTSKGPHVCVETAQQTAQVALLERLQLNWQGASAEWPNVGTIVSFAKVPSSKLMDDPNLPGWADRLSHIPPMVVIVDESHELLGRESATVRSIRKIAKRAKWVWALSGTPMPNFPRDLWAQLDIISGGQWGSNWDFVHRYAGAEKNEHGGLNTKGKTNAIELRSRVSEVMLQRSMEDVKMSLPERIRRVKKVEVDGFRIKIDGADVHSIVAEQTRKSFQYKKATIIEDVINRIVQGQKVVAFVTLVEHVAVLASGVAKGCKSARIWTAHGAHSGEARSEACIEFRAHEGAGFFVGTVQSLNVGISLVGARALLWADLTPEPHLMLQGGKRVHRPPLSHGIEEIFFEAPGTVDTPIIETVVERLGYWEDILGLSASADDLRGTFGYDKKAVLKEIYDRFVGSIGKT